MAKLTIDQDHLTLNLDAEHGAWTWNSPNGPRYFDLKLIREYTWTGKRWRSHGIRGVGWTVSSLDVLHALQARGAVILSDLNDRRRADQLRAQELEDARRAIRVQREAEALEGVVAASECANCGAPPPARGTACRYCETVAS